MWFNGRGVGKDGETLASRWLERSLLSLLLLVIGAGILQESNEDVYIRFSWPLVERSCDCLMLLY